MKEKGIFAVPTFTIFDYFAHHRESQDQAAAEAEMLDYKISEFKKQVAAGVPFAVGSDVGPFPHGTQARELTLMVQYGMKPLAVLQADMINGAKLLGWEGQIGELKPGYFADIIAVPGNPLDDISTCEHVELCDEEWCRVAPVVLARQSGVVDACLIDVGGWLSLAVVAARDTLLSRPLPRIEKPTDARGDSRSVGHQPSQPARWRRHCRGSVRGLLRALSAAAAGTAGLRRGLANRYSPGERKLPETFDASRT